MKKLIPNLLSLSRFFLCFLFLSTSPLVRFTAVFLAMCSDVLDGFLARRWNVSSPLGTFLDPITDKLFVMVALGVFYREAKIEVWQLVVFFSRDISLLLFTLYLSYKGILREYAVRAFYCGKVMTALQFMLLGLLALGIMPNSAFYGVMALFGVGSFFELLWRR